LHYLFGDKKLTCCCPVSGAARVCRDPQQSVNINPVICHHSSRHAVNMNRVEDTRVLSQQPSRPIRRLGSYVSESMPKSAYGLPWHLYSGV